jgi:aquaporin Z
MSMNPARTLGSAAGAGVFASIWIYFVAPPVGMLLAAEAFVRLRGARAVHCAKLHHRNGHRCIFRCTRAMEPAR